MPYSNNPNNQYEMLLPADPEILNRGLQRELFALELFGKGLISADLYASSALEAFEYRVEGRPDALIHTLVGDDFGGGHHLATMLSLGLEDRLVASRIFSTANPDVKLRTYRQDQKVGQFGVYKAVHVELPSSIGSTKEKRRGSTMFPDEWLTQEVIEAIIEVSNLPGKYNPKRNKDMHRGVAEGVDISVSTDPNTGRILNAFPIRRMA
jgi:hypothetical protein